MNKEVDNFYMNIDTQKRVRVVWRVHLTMAACIGGSVDVEATTQQEAAELALDMSPLDVDWDWDVGYDVDYKSVEVCHVECEAPPADAALIRPGYETGAKLDALFEPENHPKAEEVQRQPRDHDGGGSCK